jgi:hypothetical protein
VIQLFIAFLLKRFTAFRVVAWADNRISGIGVQTLVDEAIRELDYRKWLKATIRLGW